MALPVLEGEAVGPKCRASRVGLPRMGGHATMCKQGQRPGAGETSWLVDSGAPSSRYTYVRLGTRGLDASNHARMSLHVDTPIQAVS